MADRRDPRRPVDVEPDEARRRLELGARRCGGPSGRGRRRRPATARRRARAAPSTAAATAVGRARRRRRRTSRPRCPPRARRGPPNAARRIAAVALEDARRSARAPSACSSRVEPSMSVNRKVTVPRGQRRRRRSSRRADGGQCRSARSARAGAPRGRAGSRGRASAARAGPPRSPRREREAASSARRATTWALRGWPSSTDSSPKKSPGPSVRDRLAVADDPDAPSTTTKKPVPISPWRAIDVAGREVDLDRHGRRSGRRPVGVDAVEQRAAGEQLRLAVVGQRHRVLQVDDREPCCAAPARRRQPARSARSRDGRAHGLARMARHGQPRRDRRRDRRLRAVRRPARPAARGRSPTCSRRRSSPRARGSSARA